MFYKLSAATLIATTVALPALAAEPLMAINGNQIDQADPQIVTLGQMLFFDPRLSGDASTACSDCHDPEYGWSDGSELARGYPGTMHWRNSQTLVNVGFLPGGFHWDAALGSLSDQVHDAMGAGFVANIDTVLGEERLRQIPDYAQMFQDIWGEEPSQARIAESIAAYERTLVSDDSPFDLYMTGQMDAMSDAALRGMALFNGKANCSSCHSGALATDLEFHNTSVPPNIGLSEDPLRQVTFRYLMRVKGLDPAVYDALDRDPGRYLATQNPEDLGLFRTPPLRYLTYTAPYMHNGVFYTLDEVVEFYNIGGTQDAFGTKSSRIQPLGLTREEKTDLVAFLESMSGSPVTAEVPELPDYAVRAFPSSGTRVTVASLKAGSAVQPAPEPAPTPASTGGTLRMTPAKSGSSSGGMIMTPRSTSERQSSAADIVPVPAEEEVVALAEARYVAVEAGDTLGTLAKRLYGDPKMYQKLYDANRDHLRSPNDLRAGMLLRVPD